MGFCVCGGAVLNCTFGLSPSTYNVQPVSKVQSAMPLANIEDKAAVVNIPPFGMCTCQANPAVAAATAAAMGTPTPAPCTPQIAAPWTPGSATVTIGGKPALTNSSKLVCTYGGSISITNPGTNNIQVN